MDSNAHFRAAVACVADAFAVPALREQLQGLAAAGDAHAAHLARTLDGFQAMVASGEAGSPSALHAFWAAALHDGDHTSRSVEGWCAAAVGPPV